MSFEWILKLDDQFSAHAKTAKKSALSLSNALERVGQSAAKNKATGAMEKLIYKYQSDVPSVCELNPTPAKIKEIIKLIPNINIAAKLYAKLDEFSRVGLSNKAFTAPL